MSNPLFTSIPLPKVSRNTFKLSHSNKFTMTAQKLYPTLLLEGLPGDKNIVAAECLVRAMPLVSPVFQSYKISHHAFFVPMRTLSKNWEQFITGGKDGLYSDVLPYTTYSELYNTVNDIWYNSLVSEVASAATKLVAEGLADCLRMFDFAGLSFVYESQTGMSWEEAIINDYNVGDTATGAFIQKWIDLNVRYSECEVPVNLLPFVAMLKVWSEYYRDENLVDDPMAVVFDEMKLNEAVGMQYPSTDWSAEQFILLFRLRPRAWAKDRFTSALPFTQRGPDVLLPIGGRAPVVFGTDDVATSGAVQATNSLGSVGLSFSSGGDSHEITSTADFTDAELTTTINDFRRAERLQRWYENSARGGSRLNENTLAHWGVHTPDATLDRSVFLGGVSQPLVISEVEQNSGTMPDSETPQGNLAGKGISYNSGRLFKHYDSEHGFTIVFTSILQHADYMQGTPRVFTRQDRYDYAWPEFANLGEEAVKTRELYTLAGNDAVLGYTPRYSDYKSMPNELHGDMRSSLQHWSVPRVFGSAPQLTEEFIYNPPSKVAFAVESGEVDEFVGVVRFGIKSSRLLPFYGVPTI